MQDGKIAPQIKVEYEKGDYKGLKETLDKIDWEKEFNQFPSDVNKQWNVFKSKFLDAEKKFVPRKKVYINGTLNKKISMPLDQKTLGKLK